MFYVTLVYAGGDSGRIIYESLKRAEMDAQLAVSHSGLESVVYAQVGGAPFGPVISQYHVSRETDDQPDKTPLYPSQLFPDK